LFDRLAQGAVRKARKLQAGLGLDIKISALIGFDQHVIERGFRLTAHDPGHGVAQTLRPIQRTLRQHERGEVGGNARLKFYARGGRVSAAACQHAVIFGRSHRMESSNSSNIQRYN
jgi:hypothetical protein